MPSSLMAETSSILMMQILSYPGKELMISDQKIPGPTLLNLGMTRWCRNG